MAKHELGVYIFRRDLRLYDNHGLLNLAAQCKTILPVFFLDRRQIVRGRHNAAYHSNNAVQFMCESLVDLDTELRTKHGSKLRLFFGDPAPMLAEVLARTGATAVGWNADFSAYAQRRDAAMEAAATRAGATVFATDTDYTLHPMQDNLTNTGTGYKQFGAFYKRASRTAPTKPVGVPSVAWYPKSATLADAGAGAAEYPIADLVRFYSLNPHIAQHGGREAALAKMRGLGAYKDYNTKRDLLAYNTTNLSAALNFGCVSVREVYYAAREALGATSVMLKQLYWRDFYLQVVSYVPHATSYTRMMDERYDQLAWRNDKAVAVEWKALMDGRTGFLLVDAGMQEMKTTGFLHNRLRMLLGVFWTKYLRIHILHPKYGSQVGFSRMLVDAVGPSQNKMNHHWILDLDYPGKKFSAPGAPLSGRPMDVSNRMIKKWDPDCIYVKKWLPHLKDVPCRELARWDADVAKKHGEVHPAPMFDAKKKYEEWVEMCRA